MGQYYSFSNLDKKEYITPHSFDNGAKLMESAWVNNNYLNVISNLLENEWFGCKIVNCGDYSDHSSDYYMNPKWKQLKEGNENFNLQDYVLVNLDKNIYCSFEGCPEDSDGWRINPLPLLLADGNGRGGGDYRGPYQEDVGSWSYDRIGVMKSYDSRLETMNKVYYCFEE